MICAKLLTCGLLLTLTRVSVFAAPATLPTTAPAPFVIPTELDQSSPKKAMLSMAFASPLVEPESARSLFHCRNDAERAEVNRWIRQLSATAKVREAMVEKFGSQPPAIL